MNNVAGGPLFELRYRRVAEAITAAGIVALAGLSWHLQRGFSFIVDEWDILAHHHRGHLLTPYNGHLSLIPAGIYQFLALTVGIGSYRTYGTLGIAVFLAVPVTFWLTHRASCDGRLIAIATLGIAWGWSAWMNLLYGFLINFNLPLVMLLLGWWLIHRDTRRHDALAVVALAIALASSSVGVVVAAALVTELALCRAPLRRLTRFAPPIVAWLAWWLARRDPTHPATFAERATYAWHMIVGMLAGFTLGWKPGAALSALAIVTIVIVAWRRWHTIDAHVMAIGIALASFVALTAYSRAGDLFLNPPDASRYVWLGDFLIIAALVWCVRGRVIPWPALAAGALVVVVGAVASVGHLGTYRRYVLAYGDRTRPYLVEAQAAGPRADQTRVLPLNLIPVTVGEYRDLVDHVGSPVTGVPFARLGSESARSAADRLFIGDENIGTRAVTDVPVCPTRWQRLRGAHSLTGARVDPGSTVSIANPASATRVEIRRLARRFDASSQLAISSRSIRLVAFPSDGSRHPWWLRTDSDAVSLDVCASHVAND